MHAQASATWREPHRLPAILFLDDFDADQDPPTVVGEPSLPSEPLITPDELERARESGHADGFAAGLAYASAEREQIAAAALPKIAAALDATRDDARDAANGQADAIARALMAGVAALVPALFERHGAAEAAAMARAILPGLIDEPRVTIKVAQASVAAIGSELERLDPEHRARTSVESDASCAPGDVRIEWSGGSAVRDTGEIWRGVADALGPLGWPALTGNSGDRIQ